MVSRKIFFLVISCVLGVGARTVIAGEMPAVGGAGGDLVRCVSLPCAKNDVSRNLWIAKTKARLPVGVLVLCPDKEQDAKIFLTDPAWQDFAEDHRLGLVALTLAGTPLAGKPPRPMSNLSAATLVLQAIDQEYGGGIPVALYAWPQQADFTAGLLAENPKRVLGWCLRMPGHLPALGSTTSPGIVTCQKENKLNYDALLRDFVASRKRGGRITWIALPGEKPAEKVPALDVFVRDYFAAEFGYKPGLEQWASIETKQPIGNVEAESKPAVASFLPQPVLAASWAALHVPGGPEVAQQTIIEREEDTRNLKQPKLHLYLRRPAGGGNIKGVLAYCTWESDHAKIIKRLQDEQYFLVHYADARHLALVTWSTALAFSNAESADERSQQENFRDDLGFDKLADAWERGVHALCYKAAVPETDFLLYGLSAGAQWAHRLALRKPAHFLAVNIHVNSSYDWPTPAARNILWLQTTGEREYGYPAALRFYARCREMGYPIIFKAGENLGHASSPQIEEIARKFFDYALDVKAKRDDWASHADQAPGHHVASPSLYAFSGLGQAPYYADLINQEVYGSDDKDLIPQGQRVPLPTKTLAQAWGEMVNASVFIPVSHTAAAPALSISATPTSATNQGSYFGSAVPDDRPKLATAAVDASTAPAQNPPKLAVAELPKTPIDVRVPARVLDVDPASVKGNVMLVQDLATPLTPLSAGTSTAAKIPSDELSGLTNPLTGNSWSEQMSRIGRGYQSTSPAFQYRFERSIKRTAAAHPQAAQGDAAFNAAFFAEYDRLKRSHAPLLLDPSWPEQVARTLSKPSMTEDSRSQLPK